ncbi:hypothetical protein [Actinoplanes auranticolor]|uniref:Uncharacterized protein n=1 Tax=Actinoplanes auranticolor TaxID=47988 RepID=A0A919S2J3_9ACTN|nr:hypothetical protein [Actinoplanes auranticolor]GIM63141.1 hypothetical protein Aau02nite_02120 [Actinoplanes auranticolor]
MRHLRSTLYALVLAPAVWILCGVGFDQDLTGRARDNGGIESLSGVLLLVLAGAAYAILLFSPISPLGPLLAGLGFLGVGAWARIAPASYAGVWPENVASDGFDLSRPGYGLAVLLAVPMLATALSARRWRGFEPPEILFVGTIGRARGAAAVAGTPMASERTAVIPQQRQGSEFVPGFGAPSADATQVIGQTTVAQPTVALPGGSVAAGSSGAGSSAADEDEKTTVMRLGPQPVQSPAPAAEEPTQAVNSAASAASAAEEPTQAVTPGGEEATADVAAGEDATAAIPAPESPSVGEETTRNVTAGEAAEDKTTLLVLPPVTAPADDDGDEKTQLLTLPKADGPAPDPTDRGERTQVIRAGTVEPPGDRTQLLSFPAPAEPVTVATPIATPDEQNTSIVAAERPDPGEDPTTRLTPAVKQPGEATTQANVDRPATTVTSLERPADEAADDTRPLTLPTQRPPAEDDATHRP